jgi:[ribosomal protein S5]-alanine N-acetyltransferase
MKFVLETDRLKLRELIFQDALFIIELLNSPGWLQYIGDRGVQSEDQAQMYIQNGPIKSYLDNGFGLYLVYEKSSGLPVGLCGLIKRETLDHPDLGFAFLPEYMGKGYAFEAAKGVLEYAKSNLILNEIVAIVQSNNTSSIRLLNKLGFKFIGYFMHSDGKDKLELYELG